VDDWKIRLQLENVSDLLTPQRDELHQTTSRVPYQGRTAGPGKGDKPPEMSET